MEKFYSLDALSTERLRELYTEACTAGEKIVEYDKPGEEGSYEIPNFPDADILANIHSGNQNYFASVENMKDQKNCITIGLALSAYPYTSVYVEVDNSLLERFVLGYSLEQNPHKEITSAEEREIESMIFRQNPSMN